MSENTGRAPEQFSGPDARLALLDELGDGGRGWLLAYIAGSAPKVFDDAARTLASVRDAARAMPTESGLADADAGSIGRPEPEAEL